MCYGMNCPYENIWGDCTFTGRSISIDAACSTRIKTFVCCECGYEFDEEVHIDNSLELECPECGSIDIDLLE